MRTCLRCLLGVIFVLLLAGSVWAQGDVTVVHSDPAWQASYWNNRELAGYPVLQRSEATLDYNWGSGSPDPVVPADCFSARWTRYIDVPAALYRFTAVSDDGIRVYVDDKLIIDAWYTHAVCTFPTDTYLAAGHHLVKVEYYEGWGDAVARVWWTPAGEPAINNWRGEYFNNRDLAGAPALVRDDAHIDFDWGTDSPGAGIDAENFSVRWNRSLHFAEGRYRFTTETDDGVRLYADGNLVIDKWRPMARTRYCYEIQLSAGIHTIRMEYFEQTQDAVARLTWEKVTPKRWIGNIITCVPPQPYNYAWIKVYRLEADGNWVDMAPRGIGAICSTGYLKIDGLPVDPDRYGDAGHPYRVEQWIDGQLVRSVGYVERGEPEFRVRPYADNYTPWSCPAPNG